jgi:glutathione S-transferase
MLLYDSSVSGNCYKVRLLFAHLGLAYERRSVDVVDPPIGRSCLPDLTLRCVCRRSSSTTVGHRQSQARSFGTSVKARALFPTTATCARRYAMDVLRTVRHEPAIAVVSFWLAYSARPEAFADRLEERQAAGYRALAAMERQLEDREYLVGEEISLADIALYAYTLVADEGGFDLDVYPAIRRWLDHVASVPGHIRIDA